MSANHNLVDSGQVQGGAAVVIETVPIMFLRKAPLVESKWIGRYVIEMAEWSALLQRTGYVVQLDDKDHPLALQRFVHSDGERVDDLEIQSFRQSAAHSLVKFPGRTKKIQNRPYIHFDDYCNWQGRKLKGDLLKDIQI